MMSSPFSAPGSKGQVVESCESDGKAANLLGVGFCDVDRDDEVSPSSLGEVAVERLGVSEEMLRRRQVAVQELCIFESLGEVGFAGTANARKPDDGSFAPATLNAFDPEWAVKSCS